MGGVCGRKWNANDPASTTYSMQIPPPRRHLTFPDVSPRSSLTERLQGRANKFEDMKAPNQRLENGDSDTSQAENNSHSSGVATHAHNTSHAPIHTRTTSVGTRHRAGSEVPSFSISRSPRKASSPHRDEGDRFPMPPHPPSGGRINSPVDRNRALSVGDPTHVGRIAVPPPHLQQQMRITNHPSPYTFAATSGSPFEINLRFHNAISARAGMQLGSPAMTTPSYDERMSMQHPDRGGWGLSPTPDPPGSLQGRRPSNYHTPSSNLSPSFYHVNRVMTWNPVSPTAPMDCATRSRPASSSATMTPSSKGVKTGVQAPPEDWTAPVSRSVSAYQVDYKPATDYNKNEFPVVSLSLDRIQVNEMSSTGRESIENPSFVLEAPKRKLVRHGSDPDMVGQYEARSLEVSKPTFDFTEDEDYIKDVTSLTKRDLKRATEKYLSVQGNRCSWGEITIKDFYEILSNLKIISAFDQIHHGFQEGLDYRRAELTSKGRRETPTTLDYLSFVHAIHCVEPRLLVDWSSLISKNCDDSAAFGAPFFERQRSSSMADLYPIDKWETSRVFQMYDLLRTTRSNPWERREALVGLPHMLQEAAVGKLFVNGSVWSIGRVLRKFNMGLASQLTGAHRSFIVREACLCVAKMAKIAGAHFLPFTRSIMECLRTCMGSQGKPVIQKSALFCQKALILSVPETADFRVLETVIDGCEDELISVRSASIELIADCCETKFARSQTVSSKYWNRVMEVLEKPLVHGQGWSTEFEYDARHLSSIADRSNELGGGDPKTPNFKRELGKRLVSVLERIKMTGPVGRQKVAELRLRMASRAGESTRGPGVIQIPESPRKLPRGQTIPDDDDAIERRVLRHGSRSSKSLVRTVNFPDRRRSSHESDASDLVHYKAKGDSTWETLQSKRNVGRRQSTNISTVSTVDESDESGSSSDGRTNTRATHAGKKKSQDVSLDSSDDGSYEELPRTIQKSQTPAFSSAPELFMPRKAHKRSQTSHAMQYVGNWRLPNDLKSRKKKTRRVSDDMYIIEAADEIRERRLEVFVQDRRSAIVPRDRANRTSKQKENAPPKETTKVSPQSAAARVAQLELAVINENVQATETKPETQTKRSPSNSEKSPTPPSAPSGKPPTVRQSSEKKVEVKQETPASSDSGPVNPLAAKFQSLLKSTTEEELKEAYDKVDADQDGKIFYREFCLFAVEEAQLPWDVDKCKTTFKKVAKKRGDDRYITFEDLWAAFRASIPGIETFWFKMLRPDENFDGEESSEEEITSFETVYALIKDLKSPWQRRIAALETLVELVPEDRRQLDSFMEQFSDPLKVQIQDRRSQVSKAACAAAAKMVAERPRAFLPFTPFLLESLYEIVGMKGIKVMHENAHASCLKIVSSVSDNEDGTLLRAISTGTSSNRENIRGPAYEYLKVYLNKLLENPETKRNESALETLEGLLSKGIADKSQLARKNAFNGLGIFLKVEKERANKIINTMTPAVQRRFYTTIGRKDLIPKRRPIRRFQRPARAGGRKKIQSAPAAPSKALSAPNLIGETKES